MGNTMRRIQRTLAFVRTSWSIFGITLVVLLLAETGFRAIFALRDSLSATVVPDRRVLREGYAGATWPVEHFRELETLEERWEPFVYFRPKPFKGETITVGMDGLRSTWQPPVTTPASGAQRKPVEILMLGGSSLWGFGARDDETIPSLVARSLFDQKCNVRVKNLAEIGYVSTQEVIALLRELQSGYRPDVVIFYDGVNDTTSAYLEREAGVTTNEVNRREEFNLRKSPWRLTTALVANVIGNSGSYRVAQVIRRRFGLGESTPTSRNGPGELGIINLDVVRRYEANVSIVERLGREFGFEPLFYWQPVIFDKPAKVRFESEEALRYASIEPMFRAIYDAIRDSTRLRKDRAFHDLSGIFAESSDLVFIDYCHTTESANARVAAEIAQDVIALVRTPAPGDRKPGGGDGSAVATDVK